MIMTTGRTGTPRQGMWISFSPSITDISWMSVLPKHSTLHETYGKSLHLQSWFCGCIYFVVLFSKQYYVDFPSSSSQQLLEIIWVEIICDVSWMRFLKLGSQGSNLLRFHKSKTDLGHLSSYCFKETSHWHEKLLWKGWVFGPMVKMQVSHIKCLGSILGYSTQF